MTIDIKRLNNPLERGRVMHQATATNIDPATRREAADALRAWAAKNNARNAGNTGVDIGDFTEPGTDV